VYSNCGKLFRQALNENQDLGAMATNLGAELGPERKVMLGVQLYDFDLEGGVEQQQVSVSTRYDAARDAAQAIDIVYQLNAARNRKEVYQQGQSPLESLAFGANGSADVN